MTKERFFEIVEEEGYTHLLASKLWDGLFKKMEGDIHEAPLRATCKILVGIAPSDEEIEKDTTDKLDRMWEYDN